MQRFLPLLTLGVIAGFGWLFYKSGGLGPVAPAPQQGDQQQAAGQQDDAYQSPGNWSQQADGSQGNTPTAALQQRQVSPFHVASNAQPAANSNSSPADGPSIRIASFNIQTFGNTKAGRPPVIRTLAAIVQQFDVVAIQEIQSKNDYLIPNFVKLINQPGADGQNGRRYEYLVGPRQGYSQVKEQYAFLFDTARVEVDRQSVYTVGDPDGLLQRDPLIATFRAKGVNPSEAFTFTLVNMHVDEDHAAEELDALAEVYRVVRRSSQGEDDILLLGDLATDDRNLHRLGKIPGIYPLIRGIWTNTEQNRQLDNLVIHRPSTTEYTGRCGVFDVMRRWNLSVQEALQVSDHFPVWAEFSAYERDYSGRIASRRRTQW